MYTIILVDRKAQVLLLLIKPFQLEKNKNELVSSSSAYYTCIIPPCYSLPHG